MSSQTLTLSLDALQNAAKGDPAQLAILATVKADIDRRSRVLEDAGLLVWRLVAEPAGGGEQQACQRLALGAARAMCDDWQSAEIPG